MAAFLAAIDRQERDDRRAALMIARSAWADRDGFEKLWELLEL